MAIAIGATPTFLAVRASMLDSMGEDANKIFTIGGTVTDEELVDFLGWFETLTNGAFGKVTVSSSRVVTGMRPTPVSQLYNLLANFMVLTFSQAHPLNATKTIRKSFVIPAIRALAVAAGGVPDVGSVNATPTLLPDYLANVIDFLEDNLVYEDIAGDVTIGGWTFQPSMSSLATASSVIDGE